MPRYECDGKRANCSTGFLVLDPRSCNHPRETHMPIAAKDVKWVKTPKMGFSDLLYLPAIFSGMGTTLRHMVGPKVTEQYPEQEPDLPANYRGVHRLNRDEAGRVKCVACYMCSTACPAHCIDIVAAPSP